MNSAATIRHSPISIKQQNLNPITLKHFTTKGCIWQSSGATATRLPDFVYPNKFYNPADLLRPQVSVSLIKLANRSAPKLLHLFSLEAAWLPANSRILMNWQVLKCKWGNNLGYFIMLCRHALESHERTGSNRAGVPRVCFFSGGERYDPDPRPLYSN